MTRAPFRVLSMWQPWATLAVAPRADGLPAKRYETRAFHPERYTGLSKMPLPVAIHATKRKTELSELYRLRRNAAGQRTVIHAALRDVGYTAGNLPPLGAIIGVGMIVQAFPAPIITARMFGDSGGALEMALGDYSEGRWAWQLAHVIQLAKPIPFKGRQQPLYQLDQATLEAVWAQL